MNLNRNLIIAAVVLLSLSVFSYRNSISRAERFERGQKFLTQLNPDNINEIEIQKSGETVTLAKSSDKYLVKEKHNYPAKNESVNRFINDMLNISLEKAVGSGESLEQELELDGGEKTTRVVLRNDAGKDMVQFYVGKSSEGGRGAYVKRIDGEDQTSYLTSRGVFLSTTADSFLDKEILDVAADKLVSVQGGDFKLEKGDDGLKLARLPKGKKESSEVSQVKGALAGLRFDKVFLADDTEVAALNFAHKTVYNLDDDSSYTVLAAKKDDKTFLKISGEMDREKVNQAASIGRDEAEDQLQAKSEVLTRMDEVQDFNNFHGSWIYEVTDYVGKKFTKKRAELMEDEEKDEDAE
ncbi:MAG: DUF4340 domain-containing protein [Acidobacteriota bacterium]|nr:DUF4340 domain-containing protein [Acidobacteriota bacterium]